MSSKIACAMIVKGEGDEPQKLERVLKSLQNHVDAVYITLTGDPDKIKEAEEVCYKYGVEFNKKQFLHTVTKDEVEWFKDFLKHEPHLKEGDKLFMFDEARNHSFAQVPAEYDWILWLDCDDVLAKGENLRRIADEGIEKGIEAYYFEYWYQVETNPQGQVTAIIIKHLRERLVRNNGAFKWIAPIHETLIEQRATKKIDNYDVVVVHLSSDQDKMNSLKRNLGNLEHLIYVNKGTDPRPIYYLAKAFFDIKETEYDDLAIILISKYIYGNEKGEHSSGWPEERSQAWEYLSELFRRKQKWDEAIGACMGGLIEYEGNIQLYIQLALNYMNKGEYERALFWVRMSRAFEVKPTTLVINPKDTEGRTLEVLYNCSLNLGKIDEAWAAAVKLTELYPNDPQMLSVMEFITRLRSERDVTKQIVDLANVLKQTNERGKIRALVNAVPSFIKDNPFMLQLKRDSIPPKYWEKDEIAIYCGQGFTTWSPQKMRNPGESFVGGSEEAVILLSEALAKEGWKVTVYGDPGEDEGEFNGVTWLPYYAFNRDDHFNILMGWRDVRFFDTDFKAKKTYLWCHDILNPMEFNEDRVRRITKVLVLSQFHRECIQNVPDEKIMITSNGISL